MDLKLKPEFEGSVVRRRPYPALQDQMDEIKRQIQECIDAGLVEENKHEDYPRHCSPCFLVAKAGSTAMRLMVDYEVGNKKTQKHSGRIPQHGEKPWRESLNADSKIRWTSAVASGK